MKIFELSEQEQQEYIFNLEEITKGLTVTGQLYKQAVKLVEQGKVILDNFKVSLNSLYTRKQDALMAEVEGYGFFGNSGYLLRIAFTEEEIVVLDSRVPRAQKSYYQCWGASLEKREFNAYLLALMLLAADYIKEHNPGDYTSRGAEVLLALYSGTATALLPERKEQAAASDVQLIPRLGITDDGLYLSFKIGKNKLFVVKSLAKLVQEYASSAEHSLGSKDSIDFEVDKFTEQAEKYYQLLKEVVEDDNFRIIETMKHGGYADEVKRIASGSNILLFGRALDSLYELVRGSEVEATQKLEDGSKKLSLRFREQEADISLLVSADMSNKGVFRGILLEGAIPQFYKGLDYAYYVADGYLNRTSLATYEKMQPLLQHMEEGSFSLKIGRRDLNKFYHQVLPELSKCAQIVERDTEIIEKYLQPEARFSFFLDYQNGKISCITKVHYGETQYNLLDVLNNGTLPANRDADKEKQFLELLRYYFNGIDASEYAFVIENDEEAMWNFLMNGVSQLMELGEVSSTDAFKRLKVRDKLNVSVGVRLDSGIMDLSVSASDFSLEELLAIISSYKNKKKFHRLKSGDFLDVAAKSVEELCLMLDAMHIAPKDFVKGKMQLPAYRALYLDKMLEQNADLYTSRDTNFRRLIKEFKTINESDFEPPQSLERILRNYQVHGYKWLRTLGSYGFGGILADDMGLGKTLQTIAVLLAAKEAGEAGISLVVCPASLVYNWQEEFSRFAPALKVLLIVGTQKERALKLQEAADYDVIITSYDLLKRDIDAYAEQSFNYEFIDEAQFIKNHTTAAAKAVKVIRAQHRFALTGTPIENRLSELWSIFDYLMPGYLYEYSMFKKELEQPIVKSGDEAASQRLKQLVAPFILRRLKQDVLKELPEKMEEVRVARFDAKQQALYDGQVVKTLRLVKSQSEEELAKSKIQILAELMKLRQICCDPGLAFSNYSGASAKRELCLEMVQSALEGEHKVLIFSQFKSMLELLAEDLKREGIAYYMITGETPKERRLELVRAFNNDATPVFLISLKAGGTGLNLTGADVVIHYDPWWNVAAQNQATDRAHRIGQTKVVSVYKLVVKNSIEEKILKLQEDKRNLAESVLNGSGSSIFTMSREELMELL